MGMCPARLSWPGASDASARTPAPHQNGTFTRNVEWALEDSNLRPQPCEGCALTN